MGPVACLLIKTPADHWSGWIFSIISSHWWLAVGQAHDQGPCAHDVVTTCSARARAPLLSSDSADRDPACAPRPAVTAPRARPVLAGSRPGLYLGHPQVLSRGFGRAWEIWPPPFQQYKMEKFWQKWINLIPGDFCQTVSHYSNKLFIVPIFVNISQRLHQRRT